MSEEIKTPINADEIIYVGTDNPSRMAIYLSECAPNLYEEILSDWAYDTVNLNLKKVLLELESERLKNEKFESVDESGNYYQPLFNHMNDEHGLILLQTEMDEIINIVNKLKNEKLTADLQASTECVDHIKETCDAYQKQNEKLRDKVNEVIRSLVFGNNEADKGLIEILEEALKETEVKNG